MKVHKLGRIALAALALTTAVSAQAAITKAPDLPAIVAITPMFSSMPDSFASARGWTFDALGSASLDGGGNWTAAVTAVEPGIFRLDADAALRINLNGDSVVGGAPLVWKNFSIRFDKGARFGVAHLHGDAYIGDTLWSADSRFAMLALPFDTHPDMLDNSLRELTLPEGEALLWSSNSSELISKAVKRTTLLADAHAYAFAEIKVSAVPEPATCLLMGLGLVGVGLARGRRAAVWAG